MKTHRLSLLAAAAAALTLAGCGGGDDADGDAAAAGGAAPAGAQGSAASDLPPAGSPAEETMNLFVGHMREAEFDLALLLVDPSSEGYAGIAKIVEIIETSGDKTDDTGITLGPFMKLMFSKPWESVEYRVISEEPERVRFDVTFPNETPSAMDVALIDGEWLLVAPEGIAKFGDIRDQLPQDMRQGAPTPAP
jgi:hypothetical protein